MRREREPQLVTLVGVPGIGKSRLVTELLTQVDAIPDLITWRQGRCLPYGEGVSFWALGEMAKAQAGILETDSAEVAEEKLADAVATHRARRRRGRVGARAHAAARRAEHVAGVETAVAMRSRPGGVSSRASPNSVRLCS